MSGNNMVCGRVPPVVSVEIGGALAGLPRLSAYIAAQRGGLPTVSFGGRRKFVQVARLAEMLGKPITAEDIAAAEAIVAARKVRDGTYRRVIT